MITVLCALENSIYHAIPNLDVYDKKRDSYTYDGTNKIVAHPPCAQWSKLRSFANEDKKEKELAFFCLEKIQKYGGILEHPHGSLFFKEAGIKPTIVVNQSWFGFPAEKKTSLYFYDCLPLPLPEFRPMPHRLVTNMNKIHRSITTLPFATWLLSSVNNQIFYPGILELANEELAI